MINTMTWSPEQLSSVENMGRILSNIPENKRDYISFAMLAYMNGIEAGMTYARLLDRSGLLQSKS